MVWLSPEVLEGVGFEAMSEDDKIEAKFSCLSTYKVQGLTLSDGDILDPREIRSESTRISFSVGNSVNSLCRMLVGDPLTDDEDKWKKEAKVLPPYLMINIAIEEVFASNCGYWKTSKERVTTYDCFPDARQRSQEFEHKLLPGLLTSISAALSSEHQSVFLIPIPSGRQLFGRTANGRLVEDLKLQASGKGFVSTPTAIEVVSERLDAALSINQCIYPKVADFFYLSGKEEDNLKKFIYGFIALEIHVHKTFERLDYKSEILATNSLPDRVRTSAVEFIGEQPKSAKNLVHRFIWCSILQWENVYESDIRTFKSVKKIRDRIFHGQEVNENRLPTYELQMLLLKLLSPKAT